MKRFGLLIMSCVLAGLTACSSTPKPATNNVPASDSTATASIKDSLKTPVDRYSYALGDRKSVV